jgi:hypothetical protein
MTKPTFDQFHLALLYEAEREKLGIQLDTIGAFQLLRDEVALMSFYSNWEPTYDKVRRQRKRLPPGPHELKRNIGGWVMLVVFTAVTVYVLGVAVQALMQYFIVGGEPGQISIPELLTFW